MGNTCLARAIQTQITLKSWGIMTKKELQGNQQKKNGCESTMNLAFHKILCQSNQSLRNG